MAKATARPQRKRLLLRESQYCGSASTDDVLARARRGLGSDSQGERAGFVQLVEAYQKLNEIAIARHYSDGSAGVALATEPFESHPPIIVPP